MKSFNQIFLKGLIVVLPITLTFYLLIWASVTVESLFGSGLKLLLGKELYIPGFGILLTIILVFLVGLLVSHYFTARFFKLFTNLLEKVPLIKAIYNPLKDLMALLPGKSSEQDRPQRVVMVPMEAFGGYAFGFVTREDLDELPMSDLVTVYIPYSYMLGGMTLLIAKEKLIKVDMPVDQALKLSVTAWIKAENK
jgi:uncharacterized membrane protein